MPCVDDVMYDVVIGNREWMKRSGLHVAADVDRTMKKLEVTGQTVVLCAVNGEWLYHTLARVIVTTILIMLTVVLASGNPHKQQQQQPFYGPLSGTTQVSQYQKKHSPAHHPDHHPTFISLFYLARSIASSLFKLHAWQSFCTTSVHVLFGLVLGLEPSTSYSIHFFTQSVSSFCSTCSYHRNLFCCSINIASSIPSPT